MRIVGWITIWVGVTWLLLLGTGWSHTLWGDITLALVTGWSVGLWLLFMDRYHEQEDYRELWRVVNLLREEAKKSISK